MTRVTLANGIELDVRDEGPVKDNGGNAPVLIFLHGFPESHRTWRHQIAHLSGRFRCIAPDQRGYRGSSKPQDVASYTPDKLIGDIFLLADALGVKDFTVVGHDWGGAIAWGVALGSQKTSQTRNGRVTRAVIMNAPHPVTFQKLLYLDGGQRASSQYMRLFRDPAQDALVREHGLAPLLVKAFEGKLGSTPEPEETAALLADWAVPEAAFGMLNWYRASPMDVPPMDSPRALPASYAPPPLPPLSIPTLVIWALDDIALPPANLDGLDALVTNLTLVKVPGCGHFVPWEAPTAVNAALDDFLAANG
ncbi:alpha/beta hydrolase [Novosphingobium sp.]|uniref:alpha/beta fold hydrolase n=1 Tax=Novosphingobium sp. TaxID=1874826 RepID=UPI0025D56B42|nr:alpha/beta hydrolase [Novosphingobium sp.]